MGIDNTAAKMILLLASNSDVAFKSTLFFGRQRNYVGHLLRRKISSRFHVSYKNLGSKYAEPLLETIGIKNFDILDVSDYEGANILHDLNEPTPSYLVEKYEVVIDIGTSEHIYNPIQSIANIRNMCKVGGRVMVLSPANSHLGHGFYQFSPELFFRGFGPNVGFKIDHIFLIKKSVFLEKWFKLRDPDTEKKRGTIPTKGRCYLGVIATKVTSENQMSMSQQSDYVTAWAGTELSKLGHYYLKSPILVQKLLDRTLILGLNRFRNRLKRQKFEWEGQHYFPKS